MQLLQSPTHSTDTTTAITINSNTSCQWEFIHHHAIQRKWHRQQTDVQCGQNEALRIIRGSHKMSSVAHLHSEIEMLQVEDRLNLLFAHYMVQCLDTENVCYHITRHNQTVLPLLANNNKDTFQAIHNSFVNTAI